MSATVNAELFQNYFEKVVPGPCVCVVGRCRLTVAKPVWKPPMISVLVTRIL
jgi:hypothetical protein